MAKEINFQTWIELHQQILDALYSRLEFLQTQLQTLPPNEKLLAWQEIGLLYKTLDTETVELTKVSIRKTLAQFKTHIPKQHLAQLIRLKTQPQYQPLPTQLTRALKEMIASEEITQISILKQKLYQTLHYTITKETKTLKKLTLLKKLKNLFRK